MSPKPDWSQTTLPVKGFRDVRSERGPGRRSVRLATGSPMLGRVAVRHRGYQQEVRKQPTSTRCTGGLFSRPLGSVSLQVTDPGHRRSVWCLLLGNGFQRRPKDRLFWLLPARAGIGRRAVCRLARRMESRCGTDARRHLDQQARTRRRHQPLHTRIPRIRPLRQGTLLHASTALRVVA